MQYLLRFIGKRLDDHDQRQQEQGVAAYVAYTEALKQQAR